MADPAVPTCIGAVNYIRELVKEKSAIVLEPSKSYLVESRLASVLRENGLDSLDRLVDDMRRNQARELVQQVVEALTTNETSFFRDKLPFDSLEKHIIPQIMLDRAKDKTLSIWSNACSSGQEIYSIAMLLQEHFPSLLNWKVRLIASDISTQILARAKEGIFNAHEVTRGLPAAYLSKYFTKHADGWKISDRIRNSIEFIPVNLVQSWPTHLNSIDVVLLRNVLIYFSPESKEEILNRIRRVIRPEGYLFLGGAETTMKLNVRFERTTIGPASCYRPT